MKKILSTLIIIVITAILTSTITIMAYSYNAKDISYTPSNNNWNVNNVKSAIDSIKNTNDTTIATLQNDKANLEAQINQINSYTTHVEFDSSRTTQTFNLGFRPNYISCTGIFTYYVIIAYNKLYDENNVVRSNGAESAKMPLSTWYTINDNGFTWNITTSSWAGTNIYCFATK